MIYGLHPTQLVVIVFLLVVLAAVGWMYLAGDREGEMVDDEPTLDVQNHRGD